MFTSFSHKSAGKNGINEYVQLCDVSYFQGDEE